MPIKRSLLISAFCYSYASAATTLTAGDIAFLGHNTDGTDQFAFVLLKGIDATTTISFTDRGWNDGSGFLNTAGDGFWSWTSDSARAAGTVIALGVNGPGLFSSSGGTLSGAAPVHSLIGDQLFAYQGDGSENTLITGLHSNRLTTGGTTTTANWDGAASSNSTSALPDSLTNGDTAIWLNNSGNEVDNWRYNANGGSSLMGTPAEIRAALHDVNNWSSDNTTAFDLSPSSFGTFDVTPVPEPSSTLLLVAGTGLLCGCRKRR